MPDHPRRAVEDIDLAIRALAAVIDHIQRRDGRLAPAARRQRADNYSSLLQNRAYAHLHMRQHRAAQRWNEEAKKHIAESSFPNLRLSASAEIEGAIAYYRGDAATARERWEAARQLALKAGRAHRAEVVARNLHRLDVAGHGDAASGGARPSTA